MWFSTPEPNSFDIACAEYCGLRHSYMYTKVVAMTPADFNAWYQEASLKAGRPYEPIPSLAAARN